jgi:hypothetical protein
MFCSISGGFLLDDSSTLPSNGDNQKCLEKLSNSYEYSSLTQIFKNQLKDKVISSEDS